MMVQYHAARRGVSIADLGVAPVVIASWASGVVEGLGERLRAERPSNWPENSRFPLLTGEVGGHGVSLTLLPIGAAGTVAVLENLIACGARVIIGLGFAGSLQPTLPVGTLILPTSCVSEEGTSPHYVGDAAKIAPAPGLAANLTAAADALGVGVAAGPLWTTDAPYRELVSKIEAYGEQGVLGVDMETSAMYALGQFRGVQVANLLAVSDELWGEWRPAFGTDELREAAVVAQDVVVQYLSSGAT
jgi:uridine phosphorylase